MTRTLVGTYFPKGECNQNHLYDERLKVLDNPYAWGIHLNKIRGGYEVSRSDFGPATIDYARGKTVEAAIGNLLTNPVKFNPR